MMTNELPNLTMETYKKVTQMKSLSSYPERVIQIGDGNFIRGFIGWMVYKMNQTSNFNGKIVSIQATPKGKVVPKLNRQNGLFTLILRGIDHGKTTEKRHVIDSINRGISPYTNWSEVLKVAEAADIEFLFSNTTEAGIRYEKEVYLENTSPLLFPGKIVALLYHRFVHFKGKKDKGWIIIPCELIENNGDELRRICLQIIQDWKLSDSFTQWLDEACTFCNTLVDRIVPGYPKDEDEDLFKQLGYTDQLVTVAEPYHLFVIEGPSYVEEKLPFKMAGLNVHFDKISSYRELKVKLLNGPHTMLATIGLLSGAESVSEGMAYDTLSTFINNALVKEVCLTLKPSEKEKSISYIGQVFDRFANPFLFHRLADISLNSYSKFKVRIWPSIYAYRNRFKKNPKRLVFAFAALLHFFKGVQEGNAYEIKDDLDVINKFRLFYREFDGSKEVLVKFIEKIIQEDFSQNDQQLELGDLCDAIADTYIRIDNEGISSALLNLEKDR